MRARRPLIGVTLFFIGGTWCGLTFAFPVFQPFIAACALTLMTMFFVRLAEKSSVPKESPTNTGALLSGAGGTFPRALSHVSMYASVLFVAWSAAAVRTADLRNCALASFSPGRGGDVELVGTVSDEPSAIDSEYAGRGITWQFTLAPESARIGPAETFETACTPVLVRLRTWSADDAPGYGDRWSLSGRLRTGSRGGGMYRRRLFLTAGTKQSHRISAGGGNPFVAWCYEQRRVVAGYLGIGISDFPDQVGLLRALILGYRQDLPPATKQNFAWTGTLHIVAISGSHVVVVAGILIFVLQALGVSRVHWGLFLSPLLVVYTVAIGMPASAVRAAVMAIVYFSAPLLRRKPDIVSSLALSALLILAVAPDQLLDLGFILSFVCVLGLIVLCPLIDRPLLRLLEPDTLRLQPEAKRVTVLRSAGRHCVALFAMTSAAWLTSTPLSAYYFDRFSLVALPANLVIVPLAFFILVAGCLSLALGPCLLIFSDVFNHANLVLVTAMVKSMDFMAHIPYGNFELEWPLWALLLWYAVLACTAFWLHSRPRQSGEERGPAQKTVGNDADATSLYSKG